MAVAGEAPAMAKLGVVYPGYPSSWISHKCGYLCVIMVKLVLNDMALGGPAVEKKAV